MFAGIDVASERHMLARLDVQGVPLGKPVPITEDREGYDALLRLLGPPPVLVAMETTGHYWKNLYAVLLAAGHDVALLNPLKIRRFQDSALERTKTDAIDATGIARFAFEKRPEAYCTLKGVLHALCNAHHLRELKALVEIEKEDWARKMQRLLRWAWHAANLAREQGKPLPPRLIALFERRYDAVLAEGLAFHDGQPALVRPAGKAKRRGRQPRRVGHNLLRRLSTRKQDVLRFLSDPAVPFTNNLAERDGRMMKLRQKISGGFRTVDAAAEFGTIRSQLSTAKKQGWDILNTLAAQPFQLLAQMRTG